MDRSAREPSSGGVSRRRFIGYLLAGPTLIAGAQLRVPRAAAALPTVQPVDAYDLSDLLTDAALPTSGLIRVIVNPDGTASFALPRAEVGQGITTAVAMTIADELDLPLDRVQVTLADAEPALVFNQLTGGSNSMHSLYTPVRIAAAAARGQLVHTAARSLGVTRSSLIIRDGRVIAPDGRAVNFGDLAQDAAVTETRAVHAQPKASAQHSLVGTSQGRIDAHEIVTGTKLFAMDLEVPGAMPTMLCRPPTINGTALAVSNRAQVEKMPGITDVVIVAHTQYVAGGVAVRGETFGQCIDAIDALDVDWGPGSAEGKSDTSVLADLEHAELPLTPQLDPLAASIDQTFTFYFRPGDPLEPNCAVADVRDGHAEIWSSLKSPIWAREQIAETLGLDVDNVTVHVTQGGGSFGRHLFCDAAFEAATISQALGKPVKLMWARTDSFRQGRAHPMCTSRVRATYSGANVISFDQRHTSVATDFTQGLGELLSAMVGTLPEGDFLGYSETIFSLTANVPYNFGAVTQLLNEIYEYNTFNTSSVRNIYSPEVCTATELITDQLAAAMGQDPVAFRRSFVRDQRLLATLNTVAQAGDWGRAMPPRTAQGIGIHSEYKSRAACLVEIDCSAATTGRPVQDGVTGPLVTKVVIAVDVGLPINPLGLEAQMMGGAMDAIAQVLTFSLHLQDGHFLEGSWDNAYYTRQWNVPADVEVIVMPSNGNPPGGAGELAVAPTMAAVASAYARATGTIPTSFPINHLAPLGFTPYPFVPPLPESPTDGLKLAGQPTTVN
ncbi:MAG TPA: molybdopterin cofactor-binding domain-containing protein [Solirubrobacteraceae bacterium]|jgi:isoquinoline 1-oxidoreductase beta subunit|nr:molybdopterin cofactor-binding domain-containing protein [Solirubrobacteraceae bacterium]